MIKKDLFDTNASLYVLSSLMRNPLLLQDDKYAFVKTDFYKPLQQIVFYAIFNIAQTGVNAITPQDIDIHIKQFDTQYEFYKKNQGFEFVEQCYRTTEGSDIKQFELYYNRLKKFSVLRDLEGIGIDTSQFYDTDKIALNRDLEDEKLNRMSIEEILNTVRNNIVGIENRHVGKDRDSSKSAKEGMRELVQELIKTPEVGLPLDGDIINWVTRGARLGKLYTYSMPSGMGKSRHMVGNACAISMPYIDKDGKIVTRKDYKHVLFVATEMQPDEIQTMILAYVSGVNEKSILLGSYTVEEEKRIRLALDILDIYGNNFLIECIPDPSIAMVKARLVKYIIQDDIFYIFYDYIFSSPGLLSEFRDVAVREDVALMMLSNSLKEVAMSYNVFIETATQLNDVWSKKPVGARDQNHIRGSKAIADKIDIGMIGVRMTEEEFEQIKPMWEEIKKQYIDNNKDGIDWRNAPDPNLVIDVYKNRRGELNAVKVYRYFDYATCRCIDYFMTDSYYRGIKNIGQFQFSTKKFDTLDLLVENTRRKTDAKDV